MKKKLLIILKTIFSVLALLMAIKALNRYEYISQFGQIDHIVGMIPVGMGIVFVGGISFLLWVRHEKQYIPVYLTVGLFVVLSATLYPKAVRGDWWIGLKEPGKDAPEPDLTEFTPFTGSDKLARLDGEASLKLNASLPVVDGAIALYPLYAALTEAVYDENAYEKERPFLFTNTNGAYEGIISGERDVIFVARPSQGQMEAAKEAGVDLVLTPIGCEGFVFLVGEENPVDNLTYQQVKNIYSGKTCTWATLGWREGGDIIAFQRPEVSGSQAGLQGVMKEMPIVVPRPLPDNSLLGTNSLMKQVSLRWQGVQPALGYSYRYWATRMFPNPEAKLLSINGVPPTTENIKSGDYLFTAKFYAVTNGEPTGNTKRLIDWILSEQGQKIIEKTGYVPLK